MLYESRQVRVYGDSVISIMDEELTRVFEGGTLMKPVCITLRAGGNVVLLEAGLVFG